MSKFYGDLQGGRGRATRQGTQKSGISGHIRGWDIGGSIACHAGTDDPNEDIVVMSLTGGSSDPGSRETLVLYAENSGLIGGQMLKLRKSLEQLVWAVESQPQGTIEHALAEAQSTLAVTLKSGC